jgi:hypothetical protein
VRLRPQLVGLLREGVGDGLGGRSEVDRVANSLA